MTPAQKKVSDNFKKALAIRKKTGCSLKDAFAKVYGKKTTATKKATPKKKKIGSNSQTISEDFFNDYNYAYEELLQSALDNEINETRLKKELKLYFKNQLKQVDNDVDYLFS
jgi:hypothetical protein